MEMNPQRVRSAEFKTVRKGADPDEVRSFLRDVADELERAQNQSTAMEARARAAVARLQELSDSQEAAPQQAADADGRVEATAEQSDAISRALVLAQRTADSLVTDAQQEAGRLVAAANDEAATTRDSTREMAATMLDEARSEARRAGEQERMVIASEVDSLNARRDFLESDVDHLEQFLIAQRSRLRDVAGEIIEITDRVPSGLGDVRRPLLSASDDASGEFADRTPLAPPDVGATSLASVAQGGDPDATQAIDFVVLTDIADDDIADDDRPAGDDTLDSGDNDLDSRDVDVAPDDADDRDFTFSFDDESR